jgi:predicted O-methyltransferase YrrM
MTQRLRGHAAFDATDCLSVTVRLTDAEPNARYTVGLNVCGAELSATRSYRLGAVRTDERGKARLLRVLSVAPGSYDAQAWVAGPSCGPEPLGEAQRVLVEHAAIDTGRYLRMRTHPRPARGARRVVGSGCETLVAGRHLRRLRSALPEIDDYPALAAESRRVLEPHRREYVSAVSTDLMTVSLELAVFLRVLCKVRQPLRIVDLGSGFSSFVLRQHASEGSPAPVVWSVDDSPTWLERTREFLTSHGLPDDNLVTWDAFLRRRPRDFDLVLHDLGSPPTRTAALPTALQVCRPGGIVVIDDMHRAWYRPYARRIVRESDGRYFSARKLTIDGLGRYAAVATR